MERINKSLQSGAESRKEEPEEDVDRAEGWLALAPFNLGLCYAMLSL